ncbi:hypothetical protein OG21DRAFT_750343 [Imleria badia]|nr:hypothetical protein OG21DRAFT_750343 [Imleria badia]
MLNSRKHDQLANAEKSLTAVLDSQNPSRHLLASRALVRARLGLWDEAIGDANESIEIQPSVLAYIAKSMAHVGKGERYKGYRACDIAFEHSHSTHVTFLLLIKAVVVFMAGEHDDAISRVEDLIATLYSNSICYVVQAYMHFLLGNALMESGDYEGAIQSFNDAGEKPRHHSNQALSLVSLISGWKFDDLDIMIRLHHCEALYAAGRMSAAESFLNIINSTDEEVFMRESITVLICTLLHRYLTTPESSGNESSQEPETTTSSVYQRN